ncbi:MAG: AtpZ/AtpI family protein [Acidimicrobiales bacterium]
MTEDRPTPAAGDGQEPEEPGPGTNKPTPSFGDLFWVGTACAIAIVAGGGIGYAIDDAAGTLPWFTLAGLAFGVLSAVLLAVNQLRKYI